MQVKRILEYKLTLGELGILENEKVPIPEFGAYADSWIKSDAQVACKNSTVVGYRGLLRQHLLPKFESRRLDELKRQDVKALIAEMVSKGLSRSTIRNAVSVLRGILSQAMEDGLVESNPALNLGRFTRAAEVPKVKGVAITSEEIERFLNAAQEVCPEYYPLFLVAVRAGLRRGELVDLRWRDSHFGKPIGIRTVHPCRAKLRPT